MALIVQKYGGSSVADAAGIKRVAARVLETRLSLIHISEPTRPAA